MKKACMLTIIGYGAPETDVEAKELMRTAWPPPDRQKAQWVELINIEPEARLKPKWDRFILSHHYDVTTDFYDSRIARHPRRTGEAWAATHLFNMSEVGNPLPKDAEFHELWDWCGQLASAEGKH